MGLGNQCPVHKYISPTPASLLRVWRPTPTITGKGGSKSGHGVTFRHGLSIQPLRHPTT